MAIAVVTETNRAKATRGNHITNCHPASGGADPCNVTSATKGEKLRSEEDTSPLHFGWRCSRANYGKVHWNGKDYA